MSSLYFDLQHGVSGDMAVGAMLGLDEDVAYLEKKLNALPVSGYHILFRKEKRSGLQGSRFEVAVDNPEHPP
ncbi:MAG: nickel insertion protein, partial [Spirochaetota bacterium]